MPEPLITTVIPTYRRPALLRRAIASVLNQTYGNFRVCVYDNASGDETPGVVEEFRQRDPRVEYVCRAKNIGPFANFVDGANRVDTPFLSFLSDDDLLLPRFFESAMQGFDRYPQAAMSTLVTLRMTAKGQFVGAPILAWPKGLVTPPDGLFSTIRYGDPGLQALLIRREVWHAFGGFDETVGSCCDLDLELRVASRLPIAVCGEPGAIGIMHPASTTVRIPFSTVWPGMRRITDKFRADPELSSEVKQQAIEMLAAWMRRVLVNRGVLRSISAGNWDEAQWATDVFVREYGPSKAARLLQAAVAFFRRVPGSHILLRLLFALRDAQKRASNLSSQSRFRSYTRLLRPSAFPLAGLAPCASAQPPIAASDPLEDLGSSLGNNG